MSLTSLTTAHPVAYEGTALLFLDRDVQPDTYYSYAICALVSPGLPAGPKIGSRPTDPVWTALSPATVAYTRALVSAASDLVPPPPFVAEVGDTHIRVDWDSGGIEPRTYRLHCSVDSAPVSTLSEPVYAGPRVSFVHRGLRPSTVYSYVVVVVDVHGGTHSSEAVAVRTQAPLLM
jgi:hypothetical protein